MAATVAIGLLATHLLLLLCTATKATLPGFPAVVNGAADPPAEPDANVGGGGRPKLQFPFPGGQPKLPFPLPSGGQPHIPLPGSQPKVPFLLPNGGQPKLPFPLSGGRPHLPFPVPGGSPQLPFSFPGGNSPEAGADCLNTVHQAESCVGDVLRSLASSSSSPVEDAVRAGSKACCVALQAVGDHCFRGVLPVSPFRALYTSLVNHACGGGGGGGGLLPGLVDLLMPGPRV